MDVKPKKINPSTRSNLPNKYLSSYCEQLELNPLSRDYFKRIEVKHKVNWRKTRTMTLRIQNLESTLYYCVTIFTRFIR